MKAGKRYELVAPILPGTEVLLPDIEQALAAKCLSNNGPFVQRLERRMEALLGVPHVVATSSCTSGLIISMRALGWRGEVIAPAFSFAATAHAISWAGCTPVLAEVDPETWLLDPQSVARLIGPETVGVLAMDLFGVPANLKALQAAAGELPILVDAAHSLGSTRPEDPAPAACVYSLHATKTIAAGEGGLVCTQNAELAERVRRLINFGFQPGSYDCPEVGLNAKLPELPAILAYHQIQGLERVVAGRQSWHESYCRALADMPSISFQKMPEDRSSNYQYSAIRIDEEVFGRSRDEVCQALLNQSIVTKPYFSPPIHRMRCYAGKLRCDHLRITEALTNSVLCLPLHPEESPATAERIAGAIRSL